MTTRDMVLQVLDQLPEDAALTEVIERLDFLRTLQERLKHADAEEKLTPDEVRQRLVRWRA
ncbi:MAG: hypothetical protein ACYDCQ_17150 [Dehalococcoidia bacterium]